MKMSAKASEGSSIPLASGYGAHGSICRDPRYIFELCSGRSSCIAVLVSIITFHILQLVILGLLLDIKKHISAVGLLFQKQLVEFPFQHGLKI